MKRGTAILIVVLCTVALAARALGAGVRPAGLAGATAPNEPSTSVSAQVERAFTVSEYQTMSTRSLRSARLVTPPTIDGNLYDWPLSEFIGVDRNTAFSFFGGISDINDLSAEIRSGWDEQTLYFAVEVRDDVLVADSEDIWRDDGVEIGIDGLYDKYSWGSDDHQYTVAVDGRTADRTTPTTDVTAAISVTARGYVVEMAVPMTKLLPGIPISGTVMGFTVGLHDDDDGGSWDAYLIWEGTNTGTKAELFGSLIFTERLEDRIASLEAKIAQLERRTRELLQILAEFEQVTPP